MYGRRVFMRKKRCTTKLGKKPSSKQHTNGRFKPGNTAGELGRPVGAKAKIPQHIKTNYEEVFEHLGGIEGMTKWAKSNYRNRAVFYQMYSKMLPSKVDVTTPGSTIIKVFSALPRPKGHPQPKKPE